MTIGIPAHTKITQNKSFEWKLTELFYESLDWKFSTKIPRDIWREIIYKFYSFVNSNFV